MEYLCSAGRAETAVASEWDEFESLPHWGQPYMAPPKDGSPQLIIRIDIFDVSRSAWM